MLAAGTAPCRERASPPPWIRGGGYTQRMNARLALSFLFALLLVAPLVAQDEEPAAPAAPEPPPAPNPVAVMKTSMGEIHIELFPGEAPKTVENFLGLAEGTKEFTDPKTGEQVKRPYYDGLVFHRVIKDFMVQGGCPLGNGSGDPGYKFEDEINAKALGLDKLKAMENDQPHPWLLIRSQQDFQRLLVMPVVQRMGITSQEQFEAKKDAVIEAVRGMTVMDAYAGIGYKYDDSRPSRMPKKGTLAMANAGPNTNGSQFFINLVDNDYLTGKHTVFGKVVKGMEVVEAIGDVEAPASAQNRPAEDVKIISVRRLKAEEE